jgi:hypothetical protein
MPTSQRRQIELGEVLGALACGVLGSIYRVWPGKVTAYHASSAGSAPPEVDVQPMVNDVRLDTTLGTLISEPWPVLPNVPLATIKIGGFVVSAAASVGDEVTLLAYDLDTTAFRASGQQGDPVDTTRHGGGYWLALPFGISDPGAVADPGANFVLGQPAGVQIQINGTNIVLGSGATDFVALASKTNAAIKAWGTWAASGTGSGYVPPTVGTRPADPNVGSTLVKCG